MQTCLILALCAGINWFGFETETHAPHGLWARNYKSMLQQTKSLGFQFIRLPYSDEMLGHGVKVSGIDFNRNPELKGLTPIQVMDRIVEHAGKIGLKVMLDRHRPSAAGQSELWYTSAVSEKRWITNWISLVRRYKKNPTVFAVDLHNEPHGRATWGDGNLATDWRLAAERAGNAILRENPKLFVVVEGIERVDDSWYWWGGNLKAADAAPVRLSHPERLLYSVHDYPASVFEQPWFSSPAFPANLVDIWREFWGNRTVFVGEFGSKLATTRDEAWLTTLVEHLKKNRHPFAYWSLNPNSGDTGGLLQNDWNTVDSKKLRFLKPLLDRSR